MLTLITAPTTLAVSLDDIRSHCTIDSTCSDARLLGYLKAAIEHIEMWLDRRLQPTVYEYKSCTWVTRLPKPPLQSIAWVKYYDSNNELQTLDSATYRVLTSSSGFGSIEYDSCPPSHYMRGDAVQVRFTAGFQAVPESAKQAIRLLVATWNENREGELVGVISKKLELGIDRLLGPLDAGLYV